MSLTVGCALPPIVAGMLVLASTTVAQDQAEAAEGEQQMISLTKLQPFLLPVSDYTGSFTERTTITGDWDGARQRLLDNGVSFDAVMTQTFRSVASGGADTGDSGYNALVDYMATLDTAKAGLWPGGFFAASGQSAFASDLPVESGAISPTDYTAAFPSVERPKTTLMEYYLIQGLAEDLGLVLGRLNPVAWDRNRFGFDPRTQFMNAAIDQQLLVGGLVSFSTYTASFAWHPIEPVNILGGIYDPEIGVDDFSAPFEEIGYYTVIETNWTLADELGGTCRLVGVYETGEATAVDNPRLLLDEILGVGLDERQSNWMLGVNFEQYVWKPKIDDRTVGTRKLKYSTSAFGFQEPGLGVFGRVALLPESRNVYSASASLGLAGRGLIPGRAVDRMGLGWYWLQASGDLEGLLGAALDNEWGSEVFYNYAITPSIQLTFDVQYIDSGIEDVDDAVVWGLRLYTQF